MKKIYLLIAMSFIAIFTQAQVTGTKTIGVDYPTIAAAVTALNTTGVGAGGATINVPAGYTETAPSGGYVLGTTLLNASLSATNTLKFIKSGAGANPMITAFTGGTSTTSDGIFKIAGADYVTIDGISLKENASNTGAAMMEWGYALVNLNAVAPFDGVQFLTIQNCAITLDKTNANGAIAIYGTNTVAAGTAPLTPLAITVPADVHSNDKFYSNTITNASIGIFIGNISVTAPAAALFGQNNDIGGSSAATGNTVSNIGSAGFNTFGLYASTQNAVNVSNNTVSGMSAITPVAVSYGIYFFGATGSATANNNTLTVNQTVAVTGNVAGIYGQNTGNLTATGNTITLTDAATNSATHYGVFSASVGTVNISSNTFKATNTATTTGGFNFVYHAATAAGGATYSSNIFDNISISTTATTYLLYASSGTLNIVANNNSINGSFTKSGAGGTVYGIYDNGSPASGTFNFNGNNFSNINLTGATGFYGSFLNTGTGQLVTANNNTIANLTTGAATVYGLYHSYGSAGSTANGNTISNISNGGTLYGMQVGNTASLGITVTGNTISGLTSTGASVVYGLLFSGGTNGIIGKNKISGITANNAGGNAYGLTIAAGTTALTVVNNLIGDLKAPLATNAADAIRGINITATNANLPINLYYNTVNINATSTGANFSTSALFATTSGTATTASLTMTNNILINTSTPNGTGVTSAYRRSSATTTNNNGASDYNLFYAGSGCTNNAMFYNGTTVYNTIASLQTALTPSNANSKTEFATPFLATTGTGATFLHLSTTTPTVAQAGGTPLGSVTDDYDGDARNVTTPDIGADEFAGVAPAACAGTPTAGAITGSANVCSGSGTILTLGGYSTSSGITIQWQSATAVGGPFTNIACATGVTYNTGAIPSGTTMYYQVVVTCSNGGATATTAVFAVTSNPIPTIAVTPAAPSICAGGSGVSLTASGASTYTWSPATGLSATTGATVTANPGATTTYTVNGISAAGCAANGTVTVTVNNPPAAPTVNPTSATICAGGVATLTGALAAGNPTVLSENFSTTAAGGIPTGWTISQPAGTAATTVLGAVATNFAGGTANEFDVNMHNSGLAENGTYALVSPVLNATGVSNLSLTFKDSLRNFSATYPYSINVETSPNGTTWTNRYTYSNAGGSTSAHPQTVNLSALDGTAAFYVRFSVIGQVFGGFDWWFDDILLTGTAAGGSPTWTPATGLYSNPAATIPYVAGTQAGTVYASPAATTTYAAVATGTGGCTASTPVVVTVNNIPTIGTQPTNQTVCAGNTATFTVAATGTGTITYQWQVSTNGGGTFTNVAGATTNTLSLPGTTTAQSGNIYHVTVTNSCGNTVSSNATLTVTAPANATISYPASPYCAGTGIVNVVRTGTAGGTYTSTSGLSLNATTGAVDQALTTAGTYTVTYTVAAAGGCPSFVTTATITVNINSVAPTGATASNPIICGNSGITNLSVVGGTLAPGATFKWYMDGCGTGTSIGTGTTLTGIAVFHTTTFYVRAEGVCNNTACASVTVNVNPVPTVVLTAAQFNPLDPAHRSVLQATVSPAGTYTYNFVKDGVTLSNTTDPRIVLTEDSAGTYVVTVTNTATGCSATSNTLTIVASSSSKIFISPTPNHGQFAVRYYATSFGMARNVIVYDGKGSKVFEKAVNITDAYTAMNVDVTKYGSGTYYVEVLDAAGKKLASGITIVEP